MLWIGPMQCIVTDGTAISGSPALFCCALEFASALLVPLFPTHWTKLKCNGSEGRCLRSLSTCNSAELTHIFTISYKEVIFFMLLEDASWGALPHSCLLPCLYRSIWIFCRFRREIFLFRDSCADVCLLWLISARIVLNAEVQNLITEFRKPFIGFSPCVWDHQVSRNQTSCPPVLYWNVKL